jgi:hypothetical protein
MRPRSPDRWDGLTCWSCFSRRIAGVRRYDIRRLPAAMLPLLMLGTPVSAAEGPPPDTQEIERLYTEGDGRFADRDYVGAADSWEGLLHILPENEGNKAIRGALVVMIAEALINAHHHLVADDGSKDKAHLERAIAILDGYDSALREAYGPGAQPDAGIAQKREEIENAIAPPEHDDDIGPCLQPCLNVEPAPLPPRRGCGGEKTPMAFVMLATLGLGIRRRRDALDKVESVLPSDVVARLRSRLDRDA